MLHIVQSLLLLVTLAPLCLLCTCSPTSTSSSPGNSKRWGVRNRGTASKKDPPFYYQTDDNEFYEDKPKNGHGLWHGLGREYNLFSGNVLPTNGGSNAHGEEDIMRGGATNTDTVSDSGTTSSNNNGYKASNRAGGRSSRSYRARNRSRSSSSSTSRSSSSSPKNPISSLRSWLTENQSSIPRIQVRVEPNTTLKLRKRFRPLKTVVTLGADFNTQLGVWQFRSSWEDSIIGGRLMLVGRELQLSKTWLLSVGAVEDLVTRLRLRAAIDLGTGKAYARFGFRTERLSPINVVEGFTLLRQLPLDGYDGHVKLEVKANFAFPEPEIEYSTEKGGRSIVGMGDIEVNIDELNLVLDY